VAPRLRAVKEHTAERALVSAPDPLDAPAAAASVRGLSRKFGDRTVLRGVDLDIAHGEFIALIGRSGSGKSTLLRALAGLDREVTGQLSAAGPVSVAFQEPRLVPWKRVLANVALGLRAADPEATARTALGEVGLAERASAWGPPRFPAARRSVRRWPARWSATRGCCCSMNRSARLTR